ncbi:WSC domain-containing protein 1-like [Pecten maximus]|uniref:WSC domain-containing protein 1-like n=1 Tax=Pecten maximus TaxID=6579 RepID=UPI001458D0D8|nr:WSC domain-containing protein 1-like [Pecten maximus]
MPESAEPVSTGVFAWTAIVKVQAESEFCPLRNVAIMTKNASFIRVALLSYPGSGNTWTRHMIQQLTGYCTGTVYCDKFLSVRGFPGECIFPNHKSKGCIVYKSHRTKNLTQFQKAVILIRNPFDALKAFFNWSSGKTPKSAGNNTTVDAPKQSKKPRDRFHALVDRSSFNTTGWNKYVKAQIRQWKSSYLVWLKTFPKRSMVVRYVDLKENLIPTLRRISKFLNVPTTEAEYICTDFNKEGQHHRKQKYSIKTSDIFTDEHISIINGAITEVMSAARYRYRLKDFIFDNEY